MRTITYGLLDLALICAALLSAHASVPTAEASITTWDCQAFTTPTDGVDGSVQWVAVTNLIGDDRNVSIKVRNKAGDVLNTSTLDLDSGEGGTKSFTLDGAHRISVSDGTEKLKVTAWVLHYDGSDLVAARELNCTKR